MQRTRQFESPAMRMSAAVAAAALAGLLALPVLAQSPTGIAGVVAPDAEPRLVQEGFVFTEGPVGTPDGGLYFSDIRPNRIYRLDTNGEISIVREQTNGANGLAVTGEGDLLAAEGDGKRISKRSRDGTVTTVIEGSEGKPFLAPNDLILDAKGGIYFTDPGPRPVVPGRTAYVTEMVSMASSRAFIGLIAATLLFGVAAPLHAKEFLKGERPQTRGYSQAVITEGGEIVWLARQLAVVDDS